jgi:hypothetical protein
MNWRWTWAGCKGLLTGFAIVTIVTAGGAGYLARDEYKGLEYCTALNSEPRCKNKVANSSLVGFSFAQGTNAKDGDPLLCFLTRHNDWYFTWDRRGHGWRNEQTYSYDNCMVGRAA